MKLLLVEDSPRLRQALQDGLRRSGFVVDAAADGREGLRLASEHTYDVIVLDLMLPEVDGWTVLGTLRERGVQTHVLVLTARDLVSDRVRGLRAGADDYLVKPFAFDELVARLQALVRRRYQEKSPVLRCGALEIHSGPRRVLCGGAEVPLSAREYALLELLALRRGEVVGRGDLCEHLYGFASEVSSNVIDVMVCSVRRKLGAHSTLIRTRRGHGYMLDASP